MDCLLCCFTPEDDGGNEEEKKIKSLNELDYFIGEKYARTLCQILDMPIVTFQEYFFLPNIGFCISCTRFIGTITRLYEQLEELHKQISESKDKVRQRLLDCQCQLPEEDPLRLLHSDSSCTRIVSASNLRKEIVKSIQAHHAVESESLDNPVLNPFFENALRDCNKNNLDDVFKEEEVETEYVNNEFQTDDICWNSSPFPSNCSSDETNDDQPSVSLPSTSKTTRSKRITKRTWQLQEEDKQDKSEKREMRSSAIVTENKTLKIVLTRLEECKLDKWKIRKHRYRHQKKKTKTRKVETRVQQTGLVQDIVIPYNAKVNAGNSRNGISDLSIPCTVFDCPVKFKSPACLRYHLRKIHNIIPARLTRTQCPHCPKTFQIAGVLEAHIRIHTGELPFVCKVCGKKFRAKKFLKNHMIIHEDTTKQSEPESIVGQRSVPISCPQCPLKCFSKYNLQNHINRVHKKEKSFMCELCPKSFFHNVNLRDHQARFHATELNLNPHKCRICDKVLSSLHYLRIHEKAHNRDTLKFKCNVEGCSYGFDRPSRLENHMLTHTDERNHLCPQCGKSFRTKGNLSNHLQHHSEERPFKCSDCPMAFKSDHGVKRHAAEVHSKINRFICVLCGEGFTVKRYLDRHIVKHTSGKLPIPGKPDPEEQVISLPVNL